LDLIPIARKANPEVKCVFMTSEPISGHVPTLKGHPELTTIIARHPEDRAFTVRNIATTITKLATGDVFAAQKYLSWGTEIQEFAITGSAQRDELSGKLQTYLDS